MRIGLRVLFGYFLIVALAAVLIAQVFVQQIKPGVRQAMEDTLIDTANLLAELAAADLKAGRIAEGSFSAAVRANQLREVGAEIYGFSKRRTSYRVIVTDARGIVVFDSEGRALGRDHSRWRDVHLTLRGRYGARSSPETPGGEHSVMHVAAPVLDSGRIIGVLTVAKPNRIVAPFIERSQKKVREAGIALLAGALAVGIAVAWWIASQLSRLRRYADAVTRGERATLPKAHGEFGALGRALATMREKLEGKQYVEEYVHALTHELKSPLAAIRGSAELLEEQGGRMSATERAGFIRAIREQGERLAQMVDKLLALAAVEHRQGIDAPQRVGLDDLLAEAASDCASRAHAAGVVMVIEAEDGLTVEGDRFLLRQAVGNLIDNAIAFSPAGARVEVTARREGARVVIAVRDYGAGVPDYAMGRVFDRFYSLARPGGGSRSSGLGLPFVAEVAALHGGETALRNAEGSGARAALALPVA
ncbi:two-component system sensor histidine kinase CreC [Lysobacter pythonis]|uniref:histidine kinase n=1 Tax=Solilutibacter pythonis TaxID=2483112 RepID=A0A3M2I4C2_9GAMM|nr:two-component system sensor histidine kinase CreC [Lysobacter pythonis]RMH94459.1 two-component system sensor histidine kinase CreC [Lysobacter pythonis]